MSRFSRDKTIRGGLNPDWNNAGTNFPTKFQPLRPLLQSNANTVADARFFLFGETFHWIC
jgi:hypothetical protein